MHSFIQKLTIFFVITLIGFSTCADDRLNQKRSRYNHLAFKKISSLASLTPSEEHELKSLHFTIIAEAAEARAFAKAKQDAELAAIEAASKAKENNLLIAKDNYRAAKLAVENTRNASFEAIQKMIKLENDTKAALIGAFIICKKDYDCYRFARRSMPPDLMYNMASWQWNKI